MSKAVLGVSYVGTINVRREEQPRKAKRGITTREVDKIRLTRALLSMKELTIKGVSCTILL